MNDFAFNGVVSTVRGKKTYWQVHGLDWIRDCYSLEIIASEVHVSVFSDDWYN